MWGHLKFTYEAPNQTTPNWIALNGIMHSQTKSCITKSSCDLHYSEILHSIEYSLTDISEQSVSPIFKVQEIQKREQRMLEVNRHTLLVWDFVNCLIF